MKRNNDTYEKWGGGGDDGQETIMPGTWWEEGNGWVRNWKNTCINKRELNTTTMMTTDVLSA